MKAAMRSPDQAKGQIVFWLHRPLTFQRAILVDSDLDVHAVDEVCGWVKNGADVVVIDGDTGEDITRSQLQNSPVTIGIAAIHDSQ